MSERESEKLNWSKIFTVPDDHDLYEEYPDKPLELVRRDEAERVVTESGVKVIKLIEEYGSIDGAHHKQWLLTQIAKLILRGDYAEWAGANGEYDEWDEGIAP
jgi:hypothetical protein